MPEGLSRYLSCKVLQCVVSLAADALMLFSHRPLVVRMQVYGRELLIYDMVGARHLCSTDTVNLCAVPEASCSLPVYMSLSHPLSPGRLHPLLVGISWCA
jgi:hypothetical protein